MDTTKHKLLEDMGIIVEDHNIVMTNIIFPQSIPLASVINAMIIMMHNSCYDCHEIDIRSDGSVRLILHLDN